MVHGHGKAACVGFRSGFPAISQFARSSSAWSSVLCTTARQISKNEQNSSGNRQPVRCRSHRNDARRPDRFSQKVQNSSGHRQPVRCPLSLSSERCSTARPIQSKSTELVRPSSTRPLSTIAVLGTMLDGQTDSVKKYRIRLAIVNPSAVHYRCPRNDA